MKLSAAIALIATASAVRLMDEDEKTKELIEKTLDAETLGDLGDLTLEDLGEEGGECLLVSTGLTLLEHGVPEEIVAEVGEHMIAGAESGAPLSEGIEALRQLGEAYEAEAEAQDKVLGDILGKVKGCAAAAKKELEGDDDDEGSDEGDDEKSSGTDLEEEEVSVIEEDDEDKSCYDDECSSGTDLAALAQKGKLKGKLEDKAEEGDDEEEEEEGDDEKSSGTDLDGEGEEVKPDELADDDEDDEDKEEEEEEEDDGEEPEYEEKSEIEEDDEEKTCVDGECSSGTDLVLAQIRDEAAEIVDELAADVEKLIDEADLDEEDLE